MFPGGRWPACLAAGHTDVQHNSTWSARCSSRRGPSSIRPQVSRWRKKWNLVLAARFCSRPSFGKAISKNLPNKKGGGAPTGASIHCPRHTPQTLPSEDASGAEARHTRRCCHLKVLRARSPLGAPLAALARRRSIPGSTPGHASWDADLAGVTRLRSQSRESTSRTGRSTGMNDAQSRPGAGLQIPPAGTALAPSIGRHRRRPFDERDSLAGCN